MLQNISISDKCCSFELSIHQGNLKKIDSTGFNNNNNSFSEQQIRIHLHLVTLQALSSKATYNLGIHEAINLEEANKTEEVFITPSLRHFSNKYKLAREGEKDKDF